MRPPETTANGDGAQPPVAEASAPTRPRPSARNLLITVVPFLVVLITFLFWYQTWFGSPLSDRDMDEYLADTSVPHRTQHALAQLGDRMARGDAATRRWYPRLVALAENREPQLRLMAAWAMGQDNRAQEFHEALRGLLNDPVPMVRWNAALGLARFGDVAAEPQLRAMLDSFTVVAPVAGALEYRSKPQDSVRNGSVVARIKPAGTAKSVDVVSPLGGSLERWVAREGAQVAAGDAVAVISPGETQIWETLRALYLVGQSQDLEAVERFARASPNISERVRQQAATTAQVIRQRAARGKG